MKNGFTEADLQNDMERLSKHLKHYDEKKLLGNIKLSMKERPDVLINPDNLIVLQIKASEVITTDKYSSGFALLGYMQKLYRAVLRENGVTETKSETDAYAI